MTAPNPVFREDLQGLRAVAILLVVVGHTDLGIFTGGFIGVDVFFVLSGYLISGLLIRELEQSSHISFISFYARRLKRLLPALIIMLLVSYIAAIFLLSGVESRAQLASSPFATTWTSNLYFTFITIDYFDELSTKDLFLHTWSLGVEEQFYLIWPVILLALFWAGNLRKNNKQSSFKLILPGLCLAFIASLFLSLYWTTHQPQAAFYLMPSRIWQFSLGAIIYFVFRDNQTKKHHLVQNWLAAPPLFTLIIGLVLIVGSSITLTPELAYPGYWALIPSIGTALVIIAGQNPSKGQPNPLAHPALIWLGDHSYSLYLWHWPIFVLGFSMGYQGQIIPALSMTFLAILISMLSFKLIERPFWKGPWSNATATRTILLSCLVMSTTVLMSYHGLKQLPKPNTNADMSNQWRMDLPAIYHMPCDAWYTHAKIEPCIFGLKSAEKTVVLLGDSIGAQWFSVIPAIFSEPHWRTVVLTKSSCAMVDEDYYYPRIKKNYKVCTDWRNAVLKTLNVLKPDIIITGSSSTYKFSDSQWVEGSSRVFKQMSQAAGVVFVIPGTPSLGFDGPGCLSRHLSPKGRIPADVCSAAEPLQNPEPVTQLLQQAASRFSNVYMLKLNDLVCPDGKCSAANSTGLVVFRDSQHLTDTFVRKQIPFIKNQIEKYQP